MKLMKKTIKDFDLKNKTVIIRVDYNVPIENGKVIDDTRIASSLDTIKYALDNNAKVILLSHLGRIKTEEDKEKNTLAPVAKRLCELLDRNVVFCDSMDFETIRRSISVTENGNVILLENTRYYDLDNNKESSNDKELAEFYASLGDVFINDAFGTIHRSHASNVGIATILPSGVGFLVEKELKELEYLDNPIRPYTVILGGAKVSDKIKVIENLVKKCENLVIGGAMANTFLKAKGYNVGASLVENEYLEFCTSILNEFGDKIILPTDVTVAKEYSDEDYTVKKVDMLDNDDIILDIGDDTIYKIEGVLKNTKSVFWNGPLGYYEIESFQRGTVYFLLYLTNNDIKTILGGGDIVAAAAKAGLKDKVSFASTGGGATLEYLEGKVLPGLNIIQDKE